MSALAPTAPTALRARLEPSAAAVAGLVAYAVLLFAPALLNDGDTYWHLAAGAWMLEHRQILHADPFSHTFAGKPWQTHEWLSEVLMALAHRAGGWSGLMALTAGAAGLAAAIAAAYLRRWLGPRPMMYALVLGLLCLAPGMLARPHILAMPILAAWMVALLSARDAGRAPSLWLLPLMAVWANMHGGFVLGLALIGPFALEALIEARSRPWPVVRAWGLFGLGAVAAAMATPHGIGGLIFPFQLMGMEATGSIDEWRPLDFSTFQPFELAVMAALFVGLTKGVKVPPLRLLLLLGLLHMSLVHSRHAMVLGLLGPMLLAQPLSAAFRPAAPATRAAVPARAMVALLLVALTAARLAMPLPLGDSRTRPVSALAAVPLETAGQPVLNDYGFGGYLIHRGVRSFIDGRADMYGDPFIKAYDRAVGGDRAALERTLAEHEIAWTIFHPRRPAVRALDDMPGWRRLYADDYAVVHVRSEPLAMSLRGPLPR